MVLSHYATFLITSYSHNFKDYVRSILYVVLREKVMNTSFHLVIPQ